LLYSNFGRENLIGFIIEIQLLLLADNISWCSRLTHCSDNHRTNRLVKKAANEQTYRHEPAMLI
jgi:hypothetical protein